LDAAANNIQRSMFDDVIRLKRADFFESEAPSEKGLLLVNPPYNVRIAANTHQFYRDMGDVLKKKYAGWTVMWITSDMEAIKSIGLRPSRKWNLFNGELECKLLQFDMYAGTKKIHKLK
jgi:putative N6-adenine-specific DNA methylase